MARPYYYRNTDIRAFLNRGHVARRLKFAADDVEIPVYEEGQHYLILTEGVGVVDASSEPCGVVFADDSFLTMREKWHKERNELLAYSYHYQRRGGPHVRFDMDQDERPGIPKHHVQFGGLTGARGQEVHAPTAGTVFAEDVIEMIVGEFFSR